MWGKDGVDDTKVALIFFFFQTKGDIALKSKIDLEKNTDACSGQP